MGAGPSHNSIILVTWAIEVNKPYSVGKESSLEHMLQWNTHSVSPGILSQGYVIHSRHFMTSKKQLLKYDCAVVERQHLTTCQVHMHPELYPLSDAPSYTVRHA